MEQLTEERVREIVREEIKKKVAETTTLTFKTAFQVNEPVDPVELEKMISQVLNRTRFVELTDKVRVFPEQE